MDKTSQIKNLIIGLFVVIATLLILLMVFFVEPSIGDGGQKIRVRFTNISDISLNTRVKLNGKIVGEVTRICEIQDARERHVDINNESVYLYLLTLAIDSNYTVYTHDEIVVKAQGVLGEKYIEINAKPLSIKDSPIRVNKNHIFDATSTDLFDSAFNELSNVSAKVQNLTTQLSQWINLYGDNLGETIQTFKNTLSSIDSAVKEFNQLNIVHDIKVTIKNMGDITYEINQILSTLHKKQFADNLADTAEAMSQITNSLQSGKGTLGRLIEEKGIYLQTESILKSMYQIMQDMNNYGVLFHHNKTWQRLHQEKIRQATSLDTPESFNHQMSSAIESIQRKLHQLMYITNKGAHENIVQDKDYQDKLYELKSNIQKIQDKIELYNKEIFLKLNSQGEK